MKALRVCNSTHFKGKEREVVSLYTIKGGMQGRMGRVYRRGRVYRSIQERKSTQVATTMLLLADHWHAYGVYCLAHGTRPAGPQGFVPRTTV